MFKTKNITITIEPRVRHLTNPGSRPVATATDAMAVVEHGSTVLALPKSGALSTEVAP
jgi:hypothetical protein